MKKIIILINILLALCKVCVGQSTVDTISNGPIIEFISSKFDFDTIIQNSDAQCRFVFFNKGKAPLVISGISTSCGCTTASYTKKPVMKGCKGYITVKYNTSTVGGFRKTIVIKSNAVNASKSILHIKGYVKSSRQK